MPVDVTRRSRVPGGSPGGSEPAADGPGGHRWGRGIGVPAAVALAVLLLAEGAVRLGRSGLATPSAWPAPELQKKYDQIVARAASGKPTDVVLVGTSLLDAGGDPIGLAAAAGGNLGVYNASLAGENLPTIAEWTDKVVVPRLHPKVVVVGFSSNDLNPATLAPVLGLTAYHRSRAVRAAEGTGSPVDRADAFLRQWSMLYRYRSVLRNPLALGGTPGVFDPKLTAGGHDLAFADQAYLQGGGPDHARLVIEGVKAALKGFTVGPQNVAVLQRMLTSLRNRGIQVLLVAMPVTADLVSFHPGGAADYERATTSFATVARDSGSDLVNPGVWPTTEFADPVHLNTAGTARFSDYLGPLLRRAAAGAAVAAGVAP